MTRRRLLFNYAIFVVLASLDNAAAGVLPPLYALIARDLEANEAALGGVTAVYILILAAAAAFWGYRGDQGQRKSLLLYGTLIWGTAMCLTGLAQTYWQLLAGQLVTAVGIGCIASIGFSVVSDIVPARRRGLALSLWSISQGIGATFGALLASSLGAYNWRIPFFIIAALGFLFAFLYLFTREPQRGQAEPELKPLFQSGQTYQHRITFADLQTILNRPTNRWLILQGFFLSLAYGSTIWIPRWAIARVQAEGYNLETATIIGNLFVTLFGIGGFLAVPAGHWGDKWQRRNPRGRATLGAIGLLGSIPFLILLFFLPFKGVFIPTDGSLLQISWAVIVSIVTNGWVALAFIVALIGIALFSAEGPNWAALITEVNLPEHRGTFVGFSRLFRAVANALSVSLTGVVISRVTAVYPAPTNYAIGLSLFQLIVIPAGLCYIFIARTAPQDSAAVRQTLSERAKGE
ncbi:MAG: MFS transporter [Ardenticatenaceae bacterium]|nr:MFS transporter [Ardenticatenaceae bacterium]